MAERDKTCANEKAVNAAVAEKSAAPARLILFLETKSPPKNRKAGTAKSSARFAARNA